MKLLKNILILFFVILGALSTKIDGMGPNTMPCDDESDCFKYGNNFSCNTSMATFGRQGTCVSYTPMTGQQQDVEAKFVKGPHAGTIINSVNRHLIVSICDKPGVPTKNHACCVFEQVDANSQINYTCDTGIKYVGFSTTETGQWSAQDWIINKDMSRGSDDIKFNLTGNNITSWGSYHGQGGWNQSPATVPATPSLLVEIARARGAQRPPCCDLWRDGEPCNNSDQCRGICAKRCKEGNKHCPDCY